jgi:hypothetical protein
MHNPDRVDERFKQLHGNSMEHTLKLQASFVVRTVARQGLQDFSS